MEHLFSINAEGGPLICLDVSAARHWRGSEDGSSDYERLCSVFDAVSGLTATMFAVAGHTAVAWEMSGPGTADVFVGREGLIRIVRAWLANDTPAELLRIAVADFASASEIGELEIATGAVAFLWAPESGERIQDSIQSNAERVEGTALDDSVFVLKVTGVRYRCRHDEVTVGSSRARRLTLSPL